MMISGFQGIRASLTGFLDVSEDQERRDITVAECVSTLSDDVGVGNR